MDGNRHNPFLGRLWSEAVGIQIGWDGILDIGDTLRGLRHTRVAGSRCVREVAIEKARYIRFGRSLREYPGSVYLPGADKCRTAWILNQCRSLPSFEANLHDGGTNRRCYSVAL